MSSHDETEKKLPPFGIRELNGPSTREGIIHITAPQYESTLRSYPDALLTYLDDDDGETITVGSGLELSQRLDEPVRSSRNIALAPPPELRPSSFEPRLIHIFDIKQTASVYEIWQEHEAYSSKSLRDIFESSHLKPEASPSFLDQLKSASNAKQDSKGFYVDYSSSPAPKPRALDLEMEDAPPAATPPPLPPKPTSATNTDADGDALQEFIETNIDTFANFLDSAANVLRKAAQKTREADSTPVESMLAGMTDVFLEIGQLGSEIINGIEYEKIPEKSEHPIGDVKSPDTDVKPETENSEPVRRNSTMNKRVSFADIKQEASKTTVPADKTTCSFVPAIESLSPEQEAEFQRLIGGDGEAAVKQFSNIMTRHHDHWRDYKPGASSGKPPKTSPGITDLLADASADKGKAPASGKVKKANIPSRTTPQPAWAPYRSFPNRPGPAIPTRQPVGPPPPNVMDLEASDADFTARYPPLMSLRRAKTISDLQQKKQNTSEPMTTKSALHRYPSIGQLEARRKSVSPPYRQSIPSPISAARTDRTAQDLLDRPISPVSPIAEPIRIALPAPKSEYKSPSVEDEESGMKTPAKAPKPKLTLQPVTGVLPNAPALPIVSKPPFMLPGSWPEPSSEGMPLHEVIESSGAFFNRMTGLKEPVTEPARSVSPALSCRNTSPPVDPFWPSPNLRRANTVATASNPAARLTRPFDPLINAPKPLFPRPPNPGPVQAPTPDAFDQLRRSATQHYPRTRGGYGNPSTVMPHTWNNFHRGSQVPMMGPLHMPYLPREPPALQQPYWMEYLRNKAHHSTAANQRNSVSYVPTRVEPPSQIDECVEKLKQMGYGVGNPNEMNRLHVYAAAAKGNVVEALEMLEEEREVVRGMGGVRKLRVL